ncbi:hypothetical protein EI94DRAFT_1707420 [Lactarius quietus]|nr:hypothetical protein EI94DRAFT_1707420 [Lactarius quietus]
MSGGNINFVLNLWAASLAIHDDDPPFSNAQHMYDTINSTPLGDIPWESFTLQSALPMVSIDFVTLCLQIGFGNRQTLSLRILKRTAQSFAPSFLVAIEQPYRLLRDIMNIGLSISLLVTYAITSDERIAMVLCSWGFLAIPKKNHVDDKDAQFCKFRCQLFHSSLAKILVSLKPSMTVPDITCFPDGHYRKAIYGLRPYIVDYPEQALLACTVQGWCPKCTAPAKGLDSGKHVRRSQAHSELLVEEFELGTLWDEYGLVGDVAYANLGSEQQVSTGKAVISFDLFMSLRRAISDLYILKAIY